MGKLKLQGGTKKKVGLQSGEERNSLEKVRKTLGFPENTQFLGYSVCRQGSGEFLSEYSMLTEGGVATTRWSRGVQSAIRYLTLSDAVTVAEHCPHAVVMGLFDTGEQIMTITMSVNR
nr:hypothetical protein [uncultured Desulfobulbus sp.]